MTDTSRCSEWSRPTMAEIKEGSDTSFPFPLLLSSLPPEATGRAHFPAETNAAPPKDSAMGSPRQFHHSPPPPPPPPLLPPPSRARRQNIMVKYTGRREESVVPPDKRSSPSFPFPPLSFRRAPDHHLGAVKKEDGMLEANRVNVGRDGSPPSPLPSPSFSSRARKARTRKANVEGESRSTGYPREGGETINTPSLFFSPLLRHRANHVASGYG